MANMREYNSERVDWTVMGVRKNKKKGWDAVQSDLLQAPKCVDFYLGNNYVKLILVLLVNLFSCYLPCLLFYAFVGEWANEGIPLTRLFLLSITKIKHY